MHGRLQWRPPAGGITGSSARETADALRAAHTAQLGTVPAGPLYVATAQVRLGYPHAFALWLASCLARTTCCRVKARTEHVLYVPWLLCVAGSPLDAAASNAAGGQLAAARQQRPQQHEQRRQQQ